MDIQIIRNHKHLTPTGDDCQWVAECWHKMYSMDCWGFLILALMESGI